MDEIGYLMRTITQVTMPIIIKYLITAAIVVLASELGKRSDRLGSIIVALPIITILAMIWLHVETKGLEQTTRVANHAYYTFWYVIPTLPMFLVLSKMLKQGVNFWLALSIYILGTLALFLLSYLILKKMGVQLI